jgi:preprotein translocase subunit YajC
MSEDVMLWSIANAQATAAAAPKASLLEQMFPMILIFVIFWFLIIMPQRKQRKQQQTFLTNLKRGDQVITGSGILGTVE